MTATSIELQLLPQTAGFGPLRCSFIVTAQPSTTQTLRALNPACSQPTLVPCTGVLAAFHLEGFSGGVWPQGRIPRGAQLPGFHTHAAQEADEHQPLLQYRRPGAWPAASSSAAPRQMTRVQVCMGHSTGHSTAQHSTAHGRYSHTSLGKEHMGTFQLLASHESWIRDAQRTMQLVTCWQVRGGWRSTSHHKSHRTLAAPLHAPT